MNRNLLLVSNSTLYGSSYLEHCTLQIKELLGNECKTVLFFPFALKDHQGYAATARNAFESMGHKLISVHEVSDKQDAVRNAEAIFVGGGNTFRLLKSFYDMNLLEPVRKRVLDDGIPYIGSSAGSNVACCTIKTTNDMPIVFPPSFDALNLVPFNINAHFIDPKPNDTHMGETREKRIIQFHEENNVPVVGLPEGSMLKVTGNNIIVLGGGAILFEQGKERKNFTENANFSFLLQ